MLPIEFRKNRQEPDLSGYYAKVISGKSTAKISALDDWCREHIRIARDGKNHIWSFRDVVCASPEELVKLRELIDGLSGEERKKLTDVSGYVVTGLYNGMRDSGARNWLESALSLRVCPYCNRNYVYQIADKASGAKTTCELDHFFPKGGEKGTDIKGYPLLAVSFYNLIPVCHYCNRAKQREVLRAFYPHMSSWEDTHKIRFTYLPKRVDYLYDSRSLEVAFCIEAEDRASDGNSYGCWNRRDIVHDLNILNLKEIYQNHAEDVRLLLCKERIWDDAYSDMIYSGFRDYFSSPGEVRRLMTGEPEDSGAIAATPLGKLKKDIIDELEKIQYTDK